MKTIYDAGKIQEIEADISSLTKAIVMHKITKQQLIDHYIKQSHLIAHQLVNLLSINDGYELSVLFHLPQANNRDILQCWAIDYLIKHEVGEGQQYSLTELAETFQYEVSIKQQDFYI
jgi:hypothetical protein